MRLHSQVFQKSNSFFLHLYIATITCTGNGHETRELEKVLCKSREEQEIVNM